ncbi:MAG: hypothetical protein U0271_26610 [Polyangiaceae bacterium]
MSQTPLRVAIATATTLPMPDPDEPALVEALAQRGAEVRVLAWDGASVDAFAESDLVVVRSTWNYVSRRDAFVAWADAVGARTELENSARTLRDNTDKAYLLELERAGIPVVPTTMLERGASAAHALEQVIAVGADVVLKPRIGAGSFATERFRLDRSEDVARARAFLEAHLAERALLAQPFMHHVEDYGERALVVIDGVLTHAVRKSPRFSGDPPRLSRVAEIADEERALAARALAFFTERSQRPPLYARVDVVPGGDGSVRVMEIELCEPFLMLGECREAVERLADATLARARAARQTRGSE